MIDDQNKLRDILDFVGAHQAAAPLFQGGTNLQRPPTVPAASPHSNPTPDRPTQVVHFIPSFFIRRPVMRTATLIVATVLNAVLLTASARGETPSTNTTLPSEARVP